MQEMQQLFLKAFLWLRCTHFENTKLGEFVQFVACTVISDLVQSANVMWVVV